VTPTSDAQAGLTLRVLSLHDCAELGLRLPLVLAIECDGAGFVAQVLSPERIDAFGSGSSMPAAVIDLVEVMRAEASSLRARRGSLSRGLAHELELLDRVLLAEGADPLPLYEVYIGAPVTTAATGAAYNNLPSRNSYLPPQGAVELTV